MLLVRGQPYGPITLRPFQIFEVGDRDPDLLTSILVHWFRRFKVERKDKTAVQRDRVIFELGCQPVFSCKWRYDKQALVLAYRTVFLSTLGFGLLVVILSFFYPDFDDRMPNETVALIRDRKERTAIKHQLEAARAAHMDLVDDGNSHHRGEKQSTMEV